MDELTRRAALLRASGAVLAGLALGGCGWRGDDEAPPADDLAEDVDVDADAEDGHAVEVAPANARRPLIPESEPTVRVRVFRTRARGRTLRIGEADQWLRVRSVEDPLLAVVVQGPVTVGAGRSSWTILDGKGFRPALEGLAPIEIASIEPGRSSVSVEDRPHPGVIRLVSRNKIAPGAMDVINDVGLESYLPGVIASELFEPWRLETYMAQAVAARSFACSEHAYFLARRHYDLTNTTRSQVYDGSTTRRRAIDAVAGTRGLVLGWADRLVPGYYSSCCGGISARASDAIGGNPINDVPPLDGRGTEEACRHASVNTWTVVEPVDRLSRRLREWGARRRPRELANLGRLAAVEIIESNPHGRPLRYRLTDSAGTIVELSSQELYRAFNGSGRTRLKSEFIHARIDGDSIMITGHGFGHGVGLCQYGAEGLAREGKTFREILAWYYPGAEIVGAYS